MTEISTLDLKNVIGSPAYRAVIVESCISARMSAVAQCVNSLKQESDAAWQKWNGMKDALAKDGKVDAATTFLSEVSEKLSESGTGLQTLSTWLAKAADESTLIEQFLETNDGLLLAKAWKAILEADVGMLTTMTGYAANDISSNNNGRAVRKIFFDLLAQAGIRITSGGSGGGAFKGSYHGSLMFTILEEGAQEQTGLKVEYQHDFDRNAGTDEKKFLSSIVSGQFFGQYNEFKQNGGANNDPEAVKALAEKIAAHLRAHYSKSE